jgi:hypothetical protein
VNTKYYANARKQSFKQTFYWAQEDNAIAPARKKEPVDDGRLRDREFLYGSTMKPKAGLKRTTNDLFHEKLHAYVITDAIKDENVLKFAVEYVGRYKQKEDNPTNVDIEVESINTREVFDSPVRLVKSLSPILIS